MPDLSNVSGAYISSALAGGAMNEQQASMAEALLFDLQAAAPGLARPLDAEPSTRFEAELEALAPGWRRAYGSALGRTIGRPHDLAAAAHVASLSAGSGRSRRTGSWRRGAGRRRRWWWSTRARRQAQARRSGWREVTVLGSARVRWRTVSGRGGESLRSSGPGQVAAISRQHSANRGRFPLNSAYLRPEFSRNQYSESDAYALPPRERPP